MSASSPEVVLSPEDIPGAVLTEPYTKYTTAALRWWLLCRGDKVPLSLKKQQLIDRKVNAVQQEGRPIVDVDGSYVYGKYQSLTESRVQVELPLNSSPPISGWVVVKEDTY